MHSKSIQRGVKQFELLRYESQSQHTLSDHIAIEEPLEIRILHFDGAQECDSPISVTMRTPGEDAELAIGFLLSEGLIQSCSQVDRVRACGSGNSIRVHLKSTVRVDLERLSRHFYTTSSCGVCGKTALEAVCLQVAVKERVDFPQISSDLIVRLPEKLRSAQKVFAQTGGLHASGLFRSDGTLLRVHEDVGRHNALDKLIGAQSFADEAALEESILVVSGRVSFELVQKSLVAGIPVLIAVGAPSSLAIELADSHHMTLIGFVRDGRFNVYSGKQRIQTSGSTV